MTSHTERVIRENAEFLQDPEILEKLLECSDLTSLHAVHHWNCYINFKNRVTVRKVLSPKKEEVASLAMERLVSPIDQQIYKTGKDISSVFRMTDSKYEFSEEGDIIQNFWVRRIRVILLHFAQPNYRNLIVHWRRSDQLSEKYHKNIFYVEWWRE